jgi:hypothetical protein
MGIAAAAETLRQIDEYYADVNQRDEAVSSQVARQLADRRPRDPDVTRQLAAYKGLDPKWHDWKSVRTVLRRVAVEMVS